MRIKIINNGPYLVRGVPLDRSRYVHRGVMVEESTGQYETEPEYALCRCGQSATKPFCDGSHARVGFNGAEVASREPYNSRAEVVAGGADVVAGGAEVVAGGAEVQIQDDERCGYARFCHRRDGDVWTMADESANPTFAAEAVDGAQLCPTGRLTALRRESGAQEIDYSPRITVTNDDPERVSASLAVRGGVPIEAADGTLYETRNRVALCRCGGSQNKPFCDASHVSLGFDDDGGQSRLRRADT